MTKSEIAEIAAWIAEIGLKGKAEVAMLAGFCARLVANGLPLARAMVLIDTLHPVHEGRVFRWDRGSEQATLAEYGSTTEGEAAERWRASAFYRLWSSGKSLLRSRIPADGDVEFPMFLEHRAAGMTDFVAIVKRFAADGVIGEMDCVHSAWMTDDPNGFADADIAALRRLMPFLGLAVKSASLGQIAETLVETYLGRDAGRRVLSGRIARGVSERIETVLWFSDLHNYTRISNSSPPEQIIPMLNDYADAVVSAIHEQAGDVLKLIGDGVLAIFPAQERSRACVAALNAATLARQSVRTLNERRGRQKPAGHRHVSRASYRRGVLRQYRKQGTSRLHRHRTGGQRGQPDRGDVPLDRPAFADFRSVRRRRLGAAATLRLGRTICSAGRRPTPGTLHARFSDLTRRSRTAPPVSDLFRGRVRPVVNLEYPRPPFQPPKTDSALIICLAIYISKQCVNRVHDPRLGMTICALPSSYSRVRTRFDQDDHRTSTRPRR